jgi:hypothetical protein
MIALPAQPQGSSSSARDALLFSSQLECTQAFVALAYCAGSRSGGGCHWLTSIRVDNVSGMQVPLAFPPFLHLRA